MRESCRMPVMERCPSCCCEQEYLAEKIVARAEETLMYCGRLEFCSIPTEVCFPCRISHIEAAQIRIAQGECSPMLVMTLRCTVTDAHGKRACLLSKLCIGMPKSLFAPRRGVNARLGASFAIEHASFCEHAAAQVELRIRIQVVFTDASACIVFPKTSKSACLPLYPPAPRPNNLHKMKKILDSCQCLE